MSYLLSITLDGLPPTVNHLYRTGGRHRYKTAEGAAYQEATAAEMRAQWEILAEMRAQREMLPARRCVGPYLGPVALHIVMTSRTRRRWDLDNRVKAVQDCLQMAGIIKDDSQITELVVRRDPMPMLDRTTIKVMTRGDEY